MFSEFKIRSVDELVFLIQALAWSFVAIVLMSDPAEEFVDQFHEYLCQWPNQLHAHL